MAINQLEQQELLEAYGMNEQERERFKVHDLSSAEWVLRKLKALAAKESEVKGLATEEKARITVWEQKELESIESSRSYFNHLLEEYMTEQRRIDPKFKISTPSGKVTMRKQQPKWNYDDSKVLEWLKANDKGQYIRIKEEINKADLKKEAQVAGNVAVDEDGEVIDGITVEEQPDTLKVEVYA